MKPTTKIFLLYLSLLCILLVSSCNSVKRVLKDPVKFDQVAKEVVKRGYCINDTVIVNSTDTLINEVKSVIRDTVDTPCPDFTAKTSNGATVTSKNGVLTVDYPIKTKQITLLKTITNNIRDLKLESILKSERDSITILYKKSQSDLKSAQSELKAAERKNLFTWLGIGIVIVIGIGLKTGILKKFIPFL